MELLNQMNTYCELVAMVPPEHLPTDAPFRFGYSTDSHLPTLCYVLSNFALLMLPPAIATTVHRVAERISHFCLQVPGLHSVD